MESLTSINEKQSRKRYEHLRNIEMTTQKD